jgi:hypothetical protein
MARVRKLPCCVLVLRYSASGIVFDACSGSTEAHHMGERGLGQKCSDLETVPFCSEHHRQWHDARGVFAGWSKETRRTFARATILKTQITLAPPAQEVAP